MKQGAMRVSNLSVCFVFVLQENSSTFWGNMLIKFLSESWMKTSIPLSCLCSG